MYKEPVIRKLQNLEAYKKQFSIVSFVEQITLIPRTWFQSRVGKDDYWGINLSMSYAYDPYFILNKFLYQDDINFKIWEDSGYRSGSDAVREYEEGGMEEEWKEAKKTEALVRSNVVANYNEKNHFDTLDAIDTLNEDELLTLNSIYWYIKHSKVFRLMIYKSKGTVIDKFRYQLATNLNVKELHGLVKKGIVSFPFDLEIISSKDEIKVCTCQEWAKMPAVRDYE